MKIIISVFYILLLVSCGGGEHMPLEQEKAVPPPVISEQPVEGEVGEAEESKIAYEEDILPIINKNCSTCHKTGSGLPNWSNYSEAFGKRDRIMDRVVVKRNMPPQGSPPLQESEIHLIKDWMEHGAKERKSVQRRRIPGVQSMDSDVESESLNSGLYCEVIEKDSSGKIKSNNIISGTFTNGKIKKVLGVKLSFDQMEKLAEVDESIFLRSRDSAIEVCGITVGDASQCNIKTQIVDSAHAEVDVSCALESLHMNLMIEGDISTVTCKTKESKVSMQYSGCQLNL